MELYFEWVGLGEHFLWVGWGGWSYILSEWTFFIDRWLDVLFGWVDGGEWG